jgi:hypothetical protein
MDTTQIRSEVERIQKQVEEWESMIASARKELEHWSEILRLREGSSVIPAILHIPTRVLAHTLISESSEVQVAQNEVYGAKTKALRTLVRSNRENGVTIRDLTAECEKLKSNPNMAYRFVDRLTKANPPELERRGDRIYPTEHLKGD